MRHRRLPLTTGERHGLPLRVRAPHRGARRKGKGSRVVRCMGSSIIFGAPPSLLVTDVADDGLSARIDVDMFDAHRLLAAAAEPGKSFDLGGVGSQKLYGHIPGGLELRKVLGAFRAGH